MPAYDYTCNSCGRPSTLFYKSYAAYDAARADGITCPHCGSADVVRVIASVALPKPAADRSYAKMSSSEMLNVLESGRASDVNEMVRQVNDTAKGTPTS
jgi:putative FmdB family regulatory protein